VPTSPTNCYRTTVESAKSDFPTTFESNFDQTVAVNFNHFHSINHLQTLNYGVHYSKCSE